MNEYDPIVMDWYDPRVMELHRQIQDVLWFHWDPIGVNDTPRIRDEYDSYAHDILLLLFQNSSTDFLDEYLTWAAHENMGLPEVNDIQKKLREKTCTMIKSLWDDFTKGL